MKTTCRTADSPTRRAPCFPVLLLLLLLTQSAGFTSTASAGRISGRVISSGERPGPETTVLVRSVNSDVIRSVRLDPEGRFDLASVPPGPVVAFALDGLDLKRPPLAATSTVVPETGATTMILRIGAAGTGTFNFKLYRGEYFDNRPDRASADPVTVVDGATIPGRDFQLTPGGGSISGRVTRDGDGQPVAGLVIVALGRTDFAISFDRTDPDGQYRISGLPQDTYLVSVNTYLTAGENDYVPEFYNNTSDITLAASVPVTEGQDTPNIHFGLATGGSIHGRVTAETSGDAVPFATVTARSTTNPLLQIFALSRADGTFEMHGVRAGLYSVEAIADGNYLPEFYDNRSSSETADPVTVTGGAATNGIDFSLPAGGVITGVVRHQVTTDPLEDLLVVATQTGDFISHTANTDTGGVYRVEGLPAGMYRVGVPEIGKWYDNRTSEEAADPVAVTTGQTVSGIDISGVPPGGCTPGAGSALGGTVLGGGSPLPGAIVSMWRTVGNSRIQVTSAETDFDGSFLFPCLDPGTYFVRAVGPFTRYLTEWYDGADSAAATPVVLVNGVPGNSVDFDLMAGAAIEGRVTAMDSGEPLAFAEVFAMKSGGGAIASTLTGEDGAYILDGSPEGGLTGGNYVLWTGDVSTVDLSLVPVRLVRFSADALENAVLLSWEVDTDEPGLSFVLYRRETAAPGDRFERLTDRPLTGSSPLSYRDSGVTGEITYRYRLASIDRSGREEILGDVQVLAGRPAASRLSDAVPNPFRTATVLRYAVAEAGPVTLRVYDTQGRLARTLVNERREPGLQSVPWDGLDDGGRRLPAGVYHAALETGGRVSTLSIVVAR